MKIFYLFLTLLVVTSALAEPQIYRSGDVDWSYEKPGRWDFIRQNPQTFKDFFNRSFTKDNRGNLSLILVSTLVLYQFDWEIYQESRSLGRRLGLGNEDNTRTMVKAYGESIFRGPTDLGSTLYFLGDGWVHAAVMGGFLTYGGTKSDNRALQTGSQIAQGLIAGSIANQFLKRTTGRESPVRIGAHRRGNWRFFPDQNKYNTDTSKYDAFPSGHVATTMMTWTVITENYSEYNHILKPIQWTMISLLGFQMMNNGVHWASDYPLAIGMGYMFGKVISDNNRSKKAEDKVTISPIMGPQGTGMMVSKLW